MKEIKTKKALEIELSKLKRYSKGKVREEQYSTPSEIAGEVLWKALYNNHIKGKVIVDLGSGTGILGIGCMLLGAKKVYFIESDSTAVEMLKENLSKIESESKAVIVEGDINDFLERVDTVVTNPPFGTKKKHADREFLLKGFGVARVTYSFHKTSTIDYIMQIAKAHDFKLNERLDFDFMLWNTMEHHTKKRKYIKVSCLVFEFHSQ